MVFIREIRDKYIETYNETAELYDLAEDPGERRNIAAEAPDAVREMKQRLARRTTEGAWRR